MASLADGFRAGTSRQQHTRVEHHILVKCSASDFIQQRRWRAPILIRRGLFHFLLELGAAYQVDLVFELIQHGRHLAQTAGVRSMPKLCTGSEKRVAVQENGGTSNYNKQNRPRNCNDSTIVSMTAFRR